MAEPMLAGESLPLAKAPGDQVVGAPLNCPGTFTMRARRVGHDTMLAQIIRLVGQAQGSRVCVVTNSLRLKRFRADAAGV